MGVFLEFLGKMTIALANTGIGYIILMGSSKYESDNASVTDDPLLPTAIIFVISYTMAYMFMSIFSITSMTLLQCLYVDIDLSKHGGKKLKQNENRPKEMRKLVEAVTKS